MIIIIKINNNKYNKVKILILVYNINYFSCKYYLKLNYILYNKKHD
jgi:hypothetical protein